MPEKDDWISFRDHLISDCKKRPKPVPSSIYATYGVACHREYALYGHHPGQFGGLKDGGRAKKLNDQMGYLAKEGYYKVDSGGFITKTLDLGHRGWDFIESYQIAKTMVTYEAPYDLMFVLPPFVDDGVLIGTNGFPLTTGSYMFTIGPDLRLRYFHADNGLCETVGKIKHFVQYLPHAVLAEHADVYAAGNFGINNGRLTWVSSTSGHYRVNDKVCWSNFKATLELLGYDFDERLFRPYLDAVKLFTPLKSGMKPCLATRPPATLLTDEIVKSLKLLKNYYDAIKVQQRHKREKQIQRQDEERRKYINKMYLFDKGNMSLFQANARHEKRIEKAKIGKFD